MVTRWTSTQIASTAADARCAAHKRTCVRVFIRLLDFALQRCGENRSLESSDRCSGFEFLWTALGAGELRVTRMTSRIAGHCAEALASEDIALIVHERPRPRKSSRPEVVRFPAHHVARAVAHGAADTFDRFVYALAFFRLRENTREVVGARCTPTKLPSCR